MSENICHRHYAVVERALRFIQQHQQEQPSLAQVASHCALSEHHFQRVFSEWAGVSPKQFLQVLTREQCRKRLLNGDSLLDCSVGAGLSGSGRLHDLLVTLEAVTPGEIKSGGKGLLIVYGVHPSPFGSCFIATTPRGIHRLEFIDREQLPEVLSELKQQWPHAMLSRDDQATDQFVQKIFTPGQQVAAQSKTGIKLWLKGSPFQLKVWEALLKIPEGKLCSYQSLAELIGQPTAARAVGSAVGKNSVALLIPCHRVIRNMGVIGHYRWGETRKQAMLGWEASPGKLKA